MWLTPLPSNILVMRFEVQTHDLSILICLRYRHDWAIQMIGHAFLALISLNMSLKIFQIKKLCGYEKN